MMNEKLEKLKEISKILSEEFEKLKQNMLKEGEEVWNNLTYDEKLALLCYISKILHEHAMEGGTYRYLIYERFGFDMDAYAPLQLCGLLAIHNLISGKLKIEFEDENK